jgi:hypothetical protein
VEVQVPFNRNDSYKKGNGHIRGHTTYKLNTQERERERGEEIEIKTEKEERDRWTKRENKIERER